MKKWYPFVIYTDRPTCQIDIQKCMHHNSQNLTLPGMCVCVCCIVVCACVCVDGYVCTVRENELEIRMFDHTVVSTATSHKCLKQASIEFMACYTRPFLPDVPLLLFPLMMNPQPRPTTTFKDDLHGLQTTIFRCSSK